MFQHIARTISILLKLVSAVYLLLLVFGLAGELFIDLEATSLRVAAVLAFLVLIYPYITRRAFAERIEDEVKRINLSNKP